MQRDKPCNISIMQPDKLYNISVMQRDKPCNISIMQRDKLYNISVIKRDKPRNRMNVVRRDKPCKIIEIKLAPSSPPHIVVSLAQSVLYSVITLARILA